MTSLARAATWLVGSLLAALAVAASLLQLNSSDPVVMALAVFTAMWLAWVAFDHAVGPLRAASGAAAAPDAALVPGFVDTQATWKKY